VLYQIVGACFLATFLLLRPSTLCFQPGWAQRRMLWVGVAAMCWTLWTTRNKFTIEHVFPAKSADCLFKTCIFLQQWRLLTKEEDRDAFDVMISKIRASANSLSSVQAGS
jgi:hypothetical protein